MSIVMQNNVQAINVRDLMFGLNGVEQRIVQAVIQNQADAILEMLIVDQEDLEGELTRAMIKDHLANVKDSARDMIEDILSDLRVTLHRALNSAQVTATVVDMSFEVPSEMVYDATVALEINFPE